MDWSQYRTSHLAKYGPTSMAELSKNYKKYKQTNKTLKSPTIRPSLVNPAKVVKARSPAKVAKSVKIIRSPAKDVKARSPVKGKSNKVTLRDIEQLAKNKKFLIVVLYADWCSHCIELKKKLGPKMKNTDKIMFYNDEMIDPSLTNSFPKIMYYENGERQNDLTVDDVYDYLL